MRNTPTWFWAGYLVCVAGFVGYYVYAREQERGQPRLLFDGGPNAELRKQVEEAALRKQLAELRED